MFNEFQLPDGTWATCSRDVDAYCKRTGSTMASDFSDGYRKGRRFLLEKAREDDLRRDFVHNYRKEIWEE